jgi:aspartate beta-hydroxylase
LLERGYEHREFIAASAKKVPELSFAYQHAPSYVPGLKCQSFWPVDDFSWAAKLKKSFKIILDEFKTVTNDMKRLQQQGNNIWAGALTKQADSYGDGWRTLVLMNRGTWDTTNAQLFPRTARVVRESGIPAVEVFFASMKPHSSIKMHSDFTNFVLTSHLALDIPENGMNKCRINVGDDCRQWLNGDIMMFDTSMMHDAINETESYRYILMFRLWHPDLTKIERDALQFIYDCLEFPDLLSDDDKIKLMTKKSIRDMRTFPEIQDETLGFGKKVKERRR